MEIKAKLMGWEKLLRDKCLRNELMDVKSINIPDLIYNESNPKDPDVYIYAGF